MLTPRQWVGLKVRDAIRVEEEKLLWEEQEEKSTSFTFAKSLALAKGNSLER